MALIDQSKFKITSNRVLKWDNIVVETDEQHAQMELDRKADEDSQLAQIGNPRLHSMVADAQGQYDGKHGEGRIARLFLQQDKETMVWKNYLTPAMIWCIIKEREIRMGHGSETHTKVFTHFCTECKTYFKPCMFSMSDKKDPDNALCKWCKIDGDGHPCINSFTIDQHLYCNSKEKTCRPEGWKKLKEVRSWWSEEEWEIVKGEDREKERLRKLDEAKKLAAGMETLALN